MNNCTVTNNTARYGGGVSFGLYASATMSNCTIVGNSSGIYGGSGVYFCDGNSAQMYNCLVVGNSPNATEGATAVHMQNGTMNNCTVSGNLTGGVRIDGVNATLNNCIVWGNVWVNIWDPGSGNPNVRYTCSSPKPAGDGNTAADPLFVNTNIGNYRLTANSPCVNTGTNQDWMTSAVDLDGHRRIDRLSGLVDMGAYEFLHNITLFSIH